MFLRVIGRSLMDRFKPTTGIVGLTLIGKMIEWDPWGVPDDYECEIIENDAPVPNHIPLHRPGPLPVEFYKTMEAVISGSVIEEPAIAASTSEAKLKE